MTITIVTDSTAGITDADAWASDVAVVPLHVIVGDSSRLEGSEITADELAADLRAGRRAGTSMPAGTDFESVFRAARDSGADGVVAITLSGEISGTARAASSAAEIVNAEWGDGHINVLDSRTTAAELRFAVETAVLAAESGADVDAVAAAASAVLEESNSYFYVDTLEYLRRGGRIGAASAWFGGALAIKPILQMRAGEVAAVEKVRTSGRALRRLVAIAEESAHGHPVEYVVQHLDSYDRAAKIAERLKQSDMCVSSTVREVSAVIGAHVGPGVLGITVVPARTGDLTAQPPSGAE
ncbi:DegV family protein [Spelaeicoccus albus]|uniref:DegV family protein with EDD domain n=1 Tax=Spelaeicoccus albus TaxID=1280376 RepID=A0A7Z0D4V1_9MICO|nr:DegV family protein [Spelaeicoccus albus]NYI68836.1 DegV family protein with EDD domain [Spelaeicoccus albus]